MADQQFADQLGAAWAQHLQGKNDAAIEGFERILREAPSNIDAYYGLGLANRASGRPEKAVEYFQKSLTLVKEAIEQGPGQNRLAMLLRMTNQRLAELRDLTRMKDQ
jgi:tetratricopeptide (TPR) repeat protein